jgi:Tfp pilus assembly protein PilO
MTAQKERWYVFSAIVFAILVFAFFAWPNYRRAKAAGLEASAMEERIERLERRQEEVKRLRESYELVLAEVEQSFKAVPTSPQPAQLVQALSLEVDGVRIIDQGFTAGEGFDGGDSAFAVLPLAVTLHADFDSIFSIVDRVESMERLVNVASIRLSRSSKDADATAPPLEAAIGLHAVYDPMREGP